ncbi:Clp protease N-terminal domain-containing protein [Rubripirellula obstinata]|nr:Clp protease N-terminal domain-containing protein [Rubripirellula obstinata]
MLERFNSIAVRSIQYANQAAHRLGYTSIGANHLWAGILRYRTSPANATLASCGVRRSAIVRRLRLQHGVPRPPVPPGRRPVDPDAKSVIQLAIAIADEYDHTFIGSEHILLALSRHCADAVSGHIELLDLPYSVVENAFARRFAPPTTQYGG